MIIRASLVVAIATLSFGVCADGAEPTFASKTSRTHLLELFTSEGCSSCPPAEAWLSKLKDEPQLWLDFVPIAFHVDYWDRLGWRDPFASKRWTARQYDYSARWKSSSVYTPAFVLDGREWHNNGMPGVSTELPGVLKISVVRDEIFSANFVPAAVGQRAFELHVARLGFDQNIKVKSGENGGRKLLHDFVVLALVDEPVTSETTEIRMPSGTTKQNPGKREAVAAWITEAGQLEPIQAVGGWL